MNTELSEKNNRILIVDDNPAIHEDIRKTLCAQVEDTSDFDSAKSLLFGEEKAKPAGPSYQLDSAYQGQEALVMVQKAAAESRPYAMAFVDVRMPPGWDGIETISNLWHGHPDLQVVVCTAYSDYSWQEMMDKLGMTSSLVVLKKPFDPIEVLQLASALTEKWNIFHQLKSHLNHLDALVATRTAELQAANDKLKGEIAVRMSTETALRLSEERFSKAFKASPIPLAIQNLCSGAFLDINEGFAELTGHTAKEIIGSTPLKMNMWARPETEHVILRKLRQELTVQGLPCEILTKKGEKKDVIVCAELFEFGGELNLLILVQDISEQIKLEQQLRQSQKMDAIGQLAAGVAHDFNNILTVIQGNGTLLLNNRPPNSPDKKPLATICAAADRATKLVRQLLTFSRKQVRKPESITLRDIFSNMADMLPRVLGAQIQIIFDAPDNLPKIYADAAMMEQVIMNLAVNARDAMEGGGKLTISAEEVEIGANECRNSAESRAGSFVCLQISDTGCGISPEVLPRIFEPFFTTKPVGRGTGLGLATVFGIVKQHEGWIEIESTVGKGTTFKVFLPVSKQEPAKAQAAPPQPANASPRGSERILVVEDEEVVREFVCELLGAHGYRVHQSPTGAQALKQWSGRTSEIDLLLTDLVMPEGVGGRDLADRLLAERSDLKVIYTSGYSPSNAGKDLQWLEVKRFLAKPYQPSKLLQIVRESLDDKTPGDAENSPRSATPAPALN
jgi:PAS domain S-box-containing protein